MESPPHSPQTSPLQVSPLAMRPPNPDSPPQQTPPPPPTATYKRKIRSKSARSMASAPPLAKRKDPPTTPLSEPPPKNPKTSASTRQGAGVSTSTPQTKSPSSSKKQPSTAPQVSKLPWPLPDAAHKATFKRLKDRKVQPIRLSDDIYFVDIKLESGLDTLKDRHDQLFDFVMETRDKQKELKEIMKQLMAFLGMPPPPPSPPPKPPLRQELPNYPLAASLDKENSWMSSLKSFVVATRKGIELRIDVIPVQTPYPCYLTDGTSEN
ncbi:uncharacterized protein LOC131170377 [Hevea brasiliensis]|uniref:uncharacterized protein LOC131170377 n=1 Tax=Hevea brasiliensis TaxID=3981 RepID=UPI0025E0F138|nr:uncharacterized protein LOC131170377 [Hevea brasiliensis]